MVLLIQVTVLFAGQNIEKSPFEVNVGMGLGDANKVTARGPGLEPVGNVANKPTYFDIYTAGQWHLRTDSERGPWLWLDGRTRQWDGSRSYIFGRSLLCAWEATEAGHEGHVLASL